GATPRIVGVAEGNTVFLGDVVVPADIPLAPLRLEVLRLRPIVAVSQGFVRQRIELRNQHSRRIRVGDGKGISPCLQRGWYKRLVRRAANSSHPLRGLCRAALIRSDRSRRISHRGCRGTRE